MRRFSSSAVHIFGAACAQVLALKANDFATLCPTMPMPEVTTPPFAQVLAVFTVGNQLAFWDMCH